MPYHTIPSRGVFFFGSQLIATCCICRFAFDASGRFDTICFRRRYWEKPRREGMSALNERVGHTHMNELTPNGGTAACDHVQVICRHKIA